MKVEERTSYCRLAITAKPNSKCLDVLFGIMDCIMF